ncbi:MAG: hypothetical protein K2H90_02790 [Oscillospiraceae bacterium]|nr:hypothetical protein [Oscillospiraceae bacterium]
MKYFNGDVFPALMRLNVTLNGDKPVTDLLSDTQSQGKIKIWRYSIWH